MRLIILAFYLGSFLLDAFLSCSGTPAPAETMHFTLDGSVYNGSANLSAFPLTDSIYVRTSIYPPAPSPSLGISLKFPKAVGTYNLTSPAAGSASFATNGPGPNTQNYIWEKYYAGIIAGTVYGSGTVTVDSYTKGTMKGTFRFTAQHLGSAATKTVSNGRFSVNVQ